MKRAILILVSALTLASCANMPGSTTGGSNGGVNNSLTLAWDPSSSENVAGYVIYMGRNSGYYYRSFDVGNVLTYTFKNLDPGTYYFACTTYDALDNEGVYSNEIRITLH